MVNISLLVPTRKRVDSLERLLRSIEETTASKDSLEIVFYVDDDDAESCGFSYPSLPVIKLIGERDRMGRVTNRCYQESSGTHIMLMNDDVVFRTPGWDSAVMEASREFEDGIALVYGNDLYEEHTLAGFPVLPRTTCELMGRVCPDDYEGGFIDAHIFDIFKRLGRLGHRRTIYLKDVVFEHRTLRSERPSPGETYVTRDNDADELLYVAWADERRRIASSLARHIGSYTVENRPAGAAGLTSGGGAEGLAAGVVSREAEAGVPVVSIIICAYDNPESVMRCLESIAGDDGLRVPLEIILIVTGSAQAAWEHLGRLKHHLRFMPVGNRNLPAALNAGARLARGSYCVFLLGDCTVEPGWAACLVGTALGKDAGVVGSKLVNARNNKVEHAGIIFVEDGGGIVPSSLYRGVRSDGAGVNTTREVRAVEAAGMLVSRRLFSEAGGFDETLGSLFNIDFCMRIVTGGGKVFYAPGSIIHNSGGLAEAPDVVHRDWDVILSRWKTELHEDLGGFLEADGFRLRRVPGMPYVVPGEQAVANLRSGGRMRELAELLEESLRIVEEVVARCGASDERKRDIGFLAKELGLVYFRLGMPEKARRLYGSLKAYGCTGDVVLANHEEPVRAASIELGSDNVNAWIGARFMNPAASAVVRIALRVSRVESPADGMLAYVHRDSNGPDGLVSGGESHRVSPSHVRCGRGGGWVEFSFPGSPVLAADTSYWVMVRRLGSPDLLNYYALMSDKGSGKRNSSACTYQGPAPNGGLSRRGESLLFRVDGRLI